jgi:hypothetical protein
MSRHWLNHCVSGFCFPDPDGFVLWAGYYKPTVQRVCDAENNPAINPERFKYRLSVLHIPNPDGVVIGA